MKLTQSEWQSIIEQIDMREVDCGSEAAGFLEAVG